MATFTITLPDTTSMRALQGFADAIDCTIVHRTNGSLEFRPRRPRPASAQGNGHIEKMPRYAHQVIPRSPRHSSRKVNQ